MKQRELPVFLKFEENRGRIFKFDGKFGVKQWTIFAYLQNSAKRDGKSKGEKQKRREKRERENSQVAEVCLGWESQKEFDIWFMIASFLPVFPKWLAVCLNGNTISFIQIILYEQVNEVIEVMYTRLERCFRKINENDDLQVIPFSNKQQDSKNKR